MNKQEIKNKIDDLQQQIDKLKEMLDEPDNVRQRIKGISYYYLNCAGAIIRTTEEFCPIDDWNYNSGNRFKNFQETQDYKENLITKQKLEDLALRLNNGVEINFNKDQYKFYIYYNCSTHNLSQSCTDVIKNQGQVYCLNYHFLGTAIEEIGKETLIKLIKSGV